MTDATMEKLPTDVPGLDPLLKGGLPRGRTTLITGRSGSGKSILSLHVASRLAARGHRTTYFAAEERPSDLFTTGDALGFDTSRLGERGQLAIQDLRRKEPVILTGEYETRGLVARLGSAAEENGSSVLVIDSVSALFNPAPGDRLMRSHFLELVSSLHARGLTVILTTEAPADYSRPTLLGIEDYVCDLVLILRNVVDGKRRRRSVEVHKYRRSNHQKGEYACTITDKGLTIFPLESADASTTVSSDERFSSGVEGLDRMNSGGWLRDSIVLVRGPSGSGKTTLAGMYARAGASRGERVIYYGFEESRGVLLRNFASLGLEMKRLEESGCLELVCKYPEATSPEDMLVELRRQLDERKPSLVVLDSISSIEHSTSAEGFRTFLIGLTALLRERSRSALLTQTISSQTEARQDPPYLSTVVDAILMVDYTADAPELQRTMRVLKMRGSAHDTTQRRLSIVQGGVRVETP